MSISTRLALAILTVATGACSAQPERAAIPAPGPTSMPNVSVVGSTPAELSLRTTPAAGSTVAGPVNQLDFDFGRPVQLAEVTLSGPDGLMPMMLSPAGVQTHYSVPLPGLTAGAYSVQWRAVLDGAPKTGSFAFTVK